MVNSPSNPPSPPAVSRSPKSMHSPSRVHPSNTLILTSLPPPFFHPSLQNFIKSHFATYGDLRNWVPLAGLGRVIAVYGGWGEEAEETGLGVQAAERAKLEMDRFVIDLGNDVVNMSQPLQGNETLQELIRRLPRTTIRVYFGPSTSLAPRPPAHLSPPSVEKNFLISPPGSPPVGWVQIREDGPNRETLADDLHRALRFLSVDDGSEEPFEITHDNNDASAQDTFGDDIDAFTDSATWPNSRAPVKEIVILATSPTSSLPSVRLQPTGSTSNRTPKVIGGGCISQVKATVESMQGNPSDSSTLGSSLPGGIPPRLTRTPRPPMSS